MLDSILLSKAQSLVDLLALAVLGKVLMKYMEFRLDVLLICLMCLIVVLFVLQLQIRYFHRLLYLMLDCLQLNYQSFLYLLFVLCPIRQQRHRFVTTNKYEFIESFLLLMEVDSVFKKIKS